MKAYHCISQVWYWNVVVISYNLQVNFLIYKSTYFIEWHYHFQFCNFVKFPPHSCLNLSRCESLWLPWVISTQPMISLQHNATNSVQKTSYEHLTTILRPPYDHLKTFLYPSCEHLVIILLLSCFHLTTILQPSYDHFPTIIWPPYVYCTTFFYECLTTILWPPYDHLKFFLYWSCEHFATNF